MNKELEDLAKRVSALEKLLGKSNLFGSNLTTIGTTSSNLTLKTLGKVKIQMGSKFIDLIKDGKLNVLSKFIYVVENKESIGAKDGIYITPNLHIYLKSGNTILNIAGEVGNTYVSFMEELETTSKLKYTALKNIGFIYENILDVSETAILNGLIYVSSEQKLYIISNGTLSEFTLTIPDVFTKLFILSKNDDACGAILIKGNGINNSLAFDQLFIYTTPLRSIINSENTIDFVVGQDVIASISSYGININRKLEVSEISSIDSNSESGFRLYITDGEATLEVDNLIVRNGVENHTMIFPEFWSSSNNVITHSEETSTGGTANKTYEITLRYPNKYSVGDYIYTYGEISVENDKLLLIKVPFRIDSIDEEFNIIEITVVADIFDLSLLSEKINLTNLITFLISSGQKVNQLKYSELNIDLVEYLKIEDELNASSIVTRVGSLSDLNKSYRSNKEDILIKGFGFYSDKLFVNTAKYTSKYDLPIDDNSSSFASTEWIHKLIPKGTILMFNGTTSEIPEGWHICDGSNGTPNLIGRFIKSDSSSGQTGGANEVTLTIDNLPSHTHTVLSGPITTSTDGSHSHTYTLPVMGLSDNANDRSVVESTTSGTTSSAGEHSHTVDVSGITLSSVGNNVPVKIEPLYYSLIFIMKIV